MDGALSLQRPQLLVETLPGGSQKARDLFLRALERDDGLVLVFLTLKFIEGSMAARELQ
jgi:hypothetical protein